MGGCGSDGIGGVFGSGGAGVSGNLIHFSAKLRNGNSPIPGLCKPIGGRGLRRRWRSGQDRQPHSTSQEN